MSNLIIEQKTLIKRREYLKGLLIGCLDNEAKSYIKGKIAMIDEIMLTKGKI